MGLRDRPFPLPSFYEGFVRWLPARESHHPWRHSRNTLVWRSNIFSSVRLRMGDAPEPFH